MKVVVIVTEKIVVVGIKQKLIIKFKTKLKDEKQCENSRRYPITTIVC
jgi:ribosomal protein L13